MATKKPKSKAKRPTRQTIRIKPKDAKREKQLAKKRAAGNNLEVFGALMTSPSPRASAPDQIRALQGENQAAKADIHRAFAHLVQCKHVEDTGMDPSNSLATLAHNLRIAVVSSKRSASESRILDLEVQLDEEKRAHEETRVRLAEALDAAGLTPRPEPRKVNGSNGHDHLRGLLKLGFKRVTENGAVVEVPDEDERKFVRLCLSLAEKVGLTSASHRLNEKHALLRGKAWTPSKFTWARAQAESWT